jgi:hypothetical protein
MIWDYITFNSGHRNNYWKGNQVDIGGSGTYDWWWTSKSREYSFKATYGANQFPPDMRYVCSGYALKMWWAYRGFSDKNFSSSSYSSWYPFTPAVIYDQI